MRSSRRKGRPPGAAPAGRRGATSIASTVAHLAPRGRVRLARRRHPTLSARRLAATRAAWSPESACTQTRSGKSTRPGGATTSRRSRMAGRTSSVTGCPLRDRVTTASGLCIKATTRSSRAWERRGAAGERPEGPRAAAHRQVQANTSSCSEGVRGSIQSAAVTSTPVGSAGDRRDGKVRTSRPPSVVSKSRYSATDSQPVGRASPKLTLGRGEKPAVYASGSSTRRNARSHMRATSR